MLVSHVYAAINIFQRKYLIENIIENEKSIHLDNKL